MNGRLNEAKNVYKQDGIAVLLLKIGRTAIEPLFGRERAQRIQYKFARTIKYRQFSTPHLQLPEDRITLQEKNKNIFFGYYDQTPFCHQNRRVLFNKTDASIQPVSPSDILYLCYYDIDDQETRTFAETKTWNWQEGCRLRWHPTEEDTVIYNTLIDGKYGAVFRDVKSSREKRTYRMPVYDVDPHGQYAVSINFSRLERLHTGYGYNNLCDNTSDQCTPVDDGIYIIDLETGDCRLFVSYERLSEFVDIPDNTHNYVMGLMINPSGDYLSFLHRYHYQGERITNLIGTPIGDGVDLQMLQKKGEPSHPRWRTETELLCTVNFKNESWRSEFILYDIDSGDRYKIHHSKINEDSHPSFSPMDKNVFVGDTYPDYCGDRHLYLLDIESEEYTPLGKVYGPVHNGIKRDLHPRWDREGRYICIDVPIHQNSQAIFLINIEN